MCVMWNLSQLSHDPFSYTHSVWIQLLPHRQKNNCISNCLSELLSPYLGVGSRNPFHIIYAKWEANNSLGFDVDLLDIRKMMDLANTFHFEGRHEIISHK